MTRCHLLLLPLLLTVILSPLHAQKSGLQAGAATSNITPKMGVPLDGTISQVGPAKHVHDELWARCLVLNDGETTLAFAIIDCTMISREIHDAAKAMIEEQLGIPPQQVCIAATHTHSTPRALIGLKDDDLHREYLEDLAVRIADGVHRAHNELAPAEIGWGSFREPRFVHNRRWFMKEPAENPFGEGGERIKMNPKRMDPNLDKPTGPVDDEVYVVAIRHRETAQPIAVLANYGLHYVGGIPGGNVSADYFGVFADRIQEKWKADRLTPPFVGILSNGTSGDVNAIDFTAQPEKHAPYENMTRIARELADQAAKTIEGFDYQSEVPLGATATELTLTVRKPAPERLAWAKENAVPPETPLRLTRPQVYAREAIELAAYPDTMPVPLQAFRIGDLAIAQSPCETFASTGLGIKEGSPFNATFTIELANGYNGYLPPEDQFPYGGYETWPARSSYLEEAAEGKIREGLLELLTALKQD